MCDDRTFCRTGFKQLGKVCYLVIKAACSKRLINFNHAAVKVIDGGAGGVPPVFVDSDVAYGTADERVAFAMQVEPAVKLSVAVFMPRLKYAEHICTCSVSPSQSMARKAS
jgi:hypothetical protein